MGEIKRVIKDQVIGFIIGLTLFSVLLFAFKANAPVVLFMKAEAYSRTDHAITVKVSGFKVRKCSLVKDSFVGWYGDTDGLWTEASGAVEFPNDSSKNNSRPAGLFERQNFGLFKLNGVPRHAKTIRVTANHICDGDEAPRVTVVGPWEVGRKQ